MGGSNGRLTEIIRGIRDKNRAVRLVVSAITIETLTEIMGVMAELPNSSIDVLQMNISKTATVEKYHLIKPLYPVFIAVISFMAEEEKNRR